MCIRAFFLLLIAGVLLTGCNQAAITKTPDVSGEVLAAVITQLAGLPTPTPKPSSTPTQVSPTATSTPTTPTASLTISPTGGYPYITWTPSTCDKSAFLADLDITDYSKVAPGTVFTKTWRIQNIGTCTWTKQYRFTYISGNPMGADTIYLPRSVAPGDTIDISLQMKAPDIEEDYSNFWRLRNTAGEIFGTTFYVAIEVSKGAGSATPGTSTATTTITNTSTSSATASETGVATTETP